MLGVPRRYRAGVVFMAFMVAAAVTAQKTARRHHPLVVGWHDEFNTLDDWAP